MTQKFDPRNTKYHALFIELDGGFGALHSVRIECAKDREGGGNHSPALHLKVKFEGQVTGAFEICAHGQEASDFPKFLEELSAYLKVALSQCK